MRAITVGHEFDSRSRRSSGPKSAGRPTLKPKRRGRSIQGKFNISLKSCICRKSFSMSGRYNYAEKGKKQAREDMKGSMEFVLHIFKFN